MTTTNNTQNWFNCPAITEKGYYSLQGKAIINGSTETFKIPAVEIDNLENLENIILKAIYNAKRKDPRFYQIQHVSVEVANFKCKIY